MHLPYRRHKRNNLDAVRHLQVLLRDSTGSDSPCGEAHVGTSLPGDVKNHPPMVSRALLRPPPLLALTPYFSRYVQSAWLGRG